MNWGKNISVPRDDLICRPLLLIRLAVSLFMSYSKALCTLSRHPTSPRRSKVPHTRFTCAVPLPHKSRGMEVLANQSPSELSCTASLFDLICNLFDTINLLFRPFYIFDLYKLLPTPHKTTSHCLFQSELSLYRRLKQTMR